MSSCLVTVNRIKAIEPIAKADKIVLAQVLDWWCIVRKDDYQVGDLVIYVPPDSILPNKIIEDYKFEFLKKNGRVGILKMRGVISYGLILDNKFNFREGEEVSGILGITKWEAPDVFESRPNQMRKTSRKKLNPNFFKYCDIENSKNHPDVFCAEDDVVVLEKVHGANFRAGWLKKSQKTWFEKLLNKFFGEYEFVYGSRTVQISGNLFYKGYYGTDVYGKAASKHDLSSLCKQYPDYEFFGEVYGPKIQDLTYGKNDIDVLFYDIKDTKTETYLNYEECYKILNNLKLPVAPVLYQGKFDKDAIIALATGNSIVADKNNAVQIKEGVVVKSKEETHCKIGRKLLKFINPDYYIRIGATEFK